MGNFINAKFHLCPKAKATSFMNILDKKWFFKANRPLNSKFEMHYLPVPRQIVYMYLRLSVIILDLKLN